MHHVPYTYRLRSHETVIQHIDNSHYWGAKAAAAQVPVSESIRGNVSDATYAVVLKRLQFQAGHAIVWRDVITEWFTKMSGIPDAKDRVGLYPRRIKAESMQLDGYTPTNITPWETASHGRAVICQAQMCSVQTTWDKAGG